MTENAPAPKFNDWFTPGRFALLLGLLICATYPEIVFGRATLFHRDFAMFGYPLAAYQRECFWRGELPLWTPLSYCGLPFLAQWNTLALYPLSLFYLLLPLSWSLGVFCLGHLFLGGLGMYFLARHWTRNSFAASLAGLAFVFNAVLLHSLMWPNNMAGFGWLPWVVLTVERAWREGGRRIILAVLVATMQMLSGAPEVILLTWLFLVALALMEMGRERELRWRIPWRTSVVVILVAGLAAVQLLPFLDLLGASQRQEGFSNSKWAMPIWGWANFLVPLFRARPTALGIYVQPDQYWIQSYYLGIGISCFALLGTATVRHARVWLLAGATLACLLVALGDRGMVYTVIRHVSPVLGFMRYPIKFVILPAFLVPLLAAYFVAHCQSADDAAWRRLKRSVCVVAVVLLAAIAFVVFVAFRYPMKGASANLAMQSALSRIVLLILFCATLHALRQGKSRLQTFALFWLLALVWADMGTSGPRPNPSAPRWIYERGLAARESQMNPVPHVGDGRSMLSAEAEGNTNVAELTNATDAVLYGRLAMFGNLNLLDDVPKVIGSYSLFFREFHDVFEVLYSTSDPPSGLLDFLSVSQMNAPGRVTQWLPRPTHLPWVTGGQKAVFADGSTTLAALGNKEFDPRSQVYLPTELRGVLKATNESSPAILTKEFSSQRVQVEVKTTKPTIIVISQSFSHNWQAAVDGEPAPLLRANHAFQAVEVPAGKHELVLKYRDRSFLIGAGISLLTCVGLVGGWRRLKA